MSFDLESLQNLSPLQRAVLAMEKMQARLDELERARSEPIAIIGMSCRFPGAESPEAFWQLLYDGVSAIKEVPKDRWDIDAYYDPDPDAPGKMATRYGGFLEQVDLFDPQFFAISPREAVSMDPQQRLLLEVSWEALERAGQLRERQAGSQTGVFIGVTNNDYAGIVAKNAAFDAYFSTGNALNSLAGRLSYTLGLHGPSMVVDTACSSSLVAIHLACSSLRNQECGMALAGGVNVILSPEATAAISQARMLAPDGRCKTFDAAADGYVRGEGCGMIVLKRLSDAQADGDHILALIRGSAVNQDGPSSGLTVPNGVAQQALIRQALNNAGVKPAQVSYIEAHGTGTSLGDPIEVGALGAVFKHKRKKQDQDQDQDQDHGRATPLLIGSVKTNIGHLESAAGVAGLMKTVLALQHEVIPPHLHFKTPNPHIKWDQLPVTVPTEPTDWPSGGKIAGLSSFGASGTNAHVVLEQAPLSTDTDKAPSTNKNENKNQAPLSILTLSAKHPESLHELASRYEAFLPKGHAVVEEELANAVRWRDICFTANTGRLHFDYRLAVVAGSSAQARDKLAAFLALTPIPAPELGGARRGLGEQEPISALHQHSPAGKTPKIAFLFTGQGSQYAQMGYTLYETQPTYRQALDRCDEILQAGGYLPKPLLAVLHAEPNSTESRLLNETVFTQPALFALEYALAELLKSWGIQPAIVMGHSVGEIVAACVAGVFSLEDGLKLIAQRGRLMQISEKGEMVAVFASEERLKHVLTPSEEGSLLRGHHVILSVAKDLDIAAINGPRNVVISGKGQAVQKVVATLQAEGIKTKALEVSHAFHSPLMDPILPYFERVAEEIRYLEPAIKMVSNLTGDVATAEVTTAEYWVRHIREAVRFSDGMNTLLEQGIDLFLEIGPKPVLLGMADYCLPEEVSRDVLLPTLRPEREWEQLLSSVAELYVRGGSIEWAGFHRDHASQCHRVVLPTSPWQRQRCWVEGHVQPALVSQTRTWPLHPLLGQLLYLAGSEKIRFEAQLSPDWPAYLSDHRVFGSAILPATAYLEMALAAGKLITEAEQLVLEDVFIQEALLLPEGEGKSLQLLWTPEADNQDNRAAFQIFSFTIREDQQEEPEWTLHASGKVLWGKEELPNVIDLAALQADNAQEIMVGAYYQQFQGPGLYYGPTFQGIRQLSRIEEGRALGQIQLPAEALAEENDYILHPALLDACLQVSGMAFPDMGDTPASDGAYLPAAIDRLQLYKTPALDRPLWSEANVHPINEQTLSADFRLFDEDGNVVALISGLLLRRTSDDALRRPPSFKEWLYEIAWQPQARAPSTAPADEQSGSWLIFADQEGMAEQVASSLEKRGAHCILVSAGTQYGWLAPNHYEVNPAEVADFTSLLEEALMGRACRGVVYLWGIDEKLEENLTGNTYPSGLQVPDQALFHCGGVLHLVQALAQSGLEMPLWLVTQNAQAVNTQAPLNVYQAPLWGMGRVIAQEHPELFCVRVDLAPDSAEEALSRDIQALVEELWSPDQEDQIAFRDGTRYVAKLARSSKAAAQAFLKERPFQLKLSEYGVLDNLYLAPMVRRQPSSGEVEIEVRAAGLNFREVLKALGMLEAYFAEHLGITNAREVPFGAECSGIITRIGEDVTSFKVGDEVIAAMATGCLASFVTVRADFVTHKPANMTHEEATTLPITFLTAIYGLQQLAQMKAGDKVLIHAAAGGVGQAAVQLAQAVGAEVFATASPAKWDFLRSCGISHIMNSRTLDFAEDVMAITGGEGVDIVLNSLTGDFIPKSLEVLGFGGRFVELGKIGILHENEVREIRPDVSYFCFDLGEVAHHDPPLVRELFDVLEEAFERGRLQPLPYEVFPMVGDRESTKGDVVSAFRYMAQAKHIGKVVLALPLSSLPGAPQPSPKACPDLVRVGRGGWGVRADASYLITGGLGALGLQVANYLVAQGARHLLLSGRSGAASEAAQEAIRQLEAEGAQVKVVKADVSQYNEVVRLLEEAEPPLRGIIHAAGVLDDGVLLQQSLERFESVMAPKVAGAWNLHLASSEMGTLMPLHFFVCFSSIASLLGAPGQANYAAANAFMDALAHHRQALGLSGLSINWGPWDDPSLRGMAASLSNRNQSRVSASGFKMIRSEQGVEVLGELLSSGAAQVGVFPIDWKKFFKANGSDSPFLDTFAPTIEEKQAAQQPKLLLELEVAPVGERPRILMRHVRTQIAKVLGLTSAEQVAPRQKLFDLGLDSLMAVELRNRLAKSVGQSLRSTLLFDYPKVEALVDYLAEEVLELTTQDEQEVEEEADLEAAFDDLSQDEIATLLADKLDDLDF